MCARKASEVDKTEETLDIVETPVVHDGIFGHVEQLAQVIGARPAGTEEEQQASFFIESLLKDEAGLQTETEEFNCNPNFELPKVICCIASAVLAILSIFLPLTIVPALILTVIFAVLYGLETFGISPLTNISKKGISQNIVARYIPSAPEGAEAKAASKRKRKIIFVAHYDTGKVRAELKGPAFGALNIIHWAELVCMLLIPVVLLIRLASNASEGLLVVLNVLVVIGAIGAILPVISFVLHQTAQYNNGANCNASGVAVMAEVARRVGREIPMMEQAQDDVVMNGEEAIRESGMLPEGASLIYSDDASAANAAGGAEGADALFADAQGAQAAQVSAGVGAGVDAIFEGLGTVPSNSMEVSGAVDQVAQAQAAQAQVAQAGSAPLSGQVVEGAAASSVFADASGAAVAGAGAGVGAGAASAMAAMPAAVSAAMPAPEPEDDVPEWFKRGRAAANQHKPKDNHGPQIVQRSRFADALDAAAASSAEAAAQAARAEQAPSVAEQRLQQMRESIMGQAAGAQNALHQSVQARAGVAAGDPSAADAQAGAGAEDAGVVGAAAADVASGADTAASVDNSMAVHESAPTPADVTAGGMGVDGYLSTTLDSPDYATAAAQEAAAAAEAANVAANASAEATVASATAASLANDAAHLAAQASNQAGNQSGIQAGNRAAVQGAQGADQAAQSQLDAEQKAAVANRTISFIPVAVDQDEIFKENAALKNQAASANAAASQQARTSAQTQAAATSQGARQAVSANASAATNAGAHPSAQAGAAADGSSAARKRREIALPSLTGAIEGVKARLQDAPIDDELNGEAKSAEQIRAERLARQERLSISLPSTTSASSPVEIDEELSASETGNINVTAGAFIDASGTSSFEPVGDELIEDMAADEIYVDDADDSDYVEQITSTGALAGPGYVDMPSSRTSRVFGKFRKNSKSKRKDKDISLKDSLGLDDSFDAREVGKARGGWESFRDDSLDPFSDSDDDWNGGAFSKLKQNAAEGLNKVRGRSGSDEGYGEAGDYGYADDAYADGYDDSYAYGDGYAEGEYADGYSDAYGEYADGYGNDGYNDGYSDGYANDGYNDLYAESGYAESYGEGYADDYYEADAAASTGGRDADAGSKAGVLGGLRSKLGKVGKSSGDAASGADTGASGARSSRSVRGGSDGSRVRTRKPVANPFGDLPIDFTETQSGEREAIQQFKNGAINTEIWFVALGAELADNAGIKAFLNEHADELRGSVVIDLNGLGAGELSVIEEEGMFRPVKVSSRLKRYANKAASALGLKLGKDKMLWRDSAAYISARKGFQTLHVAGVMNGKPAYSAQADDVIDNISEDKLLQNTDFVMELIHNI